MKLALLLGCSKYCQATTSVRWMGQFKTRPCGNHAAYTVDGRDLCHQHAAQLCLHTLLGASAKGEFVIIPRMPTEDMVEAGDSSDWYKGYMDCRPVWDAMVGAALNDE